MKRERMNVDVKNARLLTLAQACALTSMGRNRCKEWCDKIGATRRFSPRLVRYDRKVIDRVLDQMEQETEAQF
jgi:hypothetical protein